MGNANSGKKTDQTENGKPKIDRVHKVSSLSHEISKMPSNIFDDDDG
jgi:hypothetical protein